MKEIDWSKAPDGTTHFRHDDPKSPWRMLKDGVWHAWFGGEWMTVTTAAEHFYIARPVWSGEGLPPVGAVCEYSLDKRSWHECHVRYVLDNDPDPDADGWKAVVWCPHLKKEQVAHLPTFKFRPLRTPEQIAAEEREKAVQQMLEDANSWGDLPAAVCLALYKAGYRKVTP